MRRAFVAARHGGPSVYDECSTGRVVGKVRTPLARVSFRGSANGAARGSEEGTAAAP